MISGALGAVGEKASLIRASGATVDVNVVLEQTSEWVDGDVSSQRVERWEATLPGNVTVANGDELLLADGRRFALESLVSSGEQVVALAERVEADVAA